MSHDKFHISGDHTAPPRVPTFKGDDELYHPVSAKTPLPVSESLVMLEEMRVLTAQITNLLAVQLGTLELLEAAFEDGLSARDNLEHL